MALKDVRTAAGLTQQELAERVGVDHSTIAKLELHDTRYLTAHYETVVNIARAMGLDPLKTFPVPRR